MSLHVFVDESRRSSMYLLVAAVLHPAQLGTTRGLMRGLRVRGERKLHFKHERDAIQKDIASALVLARVRTRVYVGTGQADAVLEQCLRVLVTELVPLGMRRLVLDSRGHAGDQLDRRNVASQLSELATDPSVVSYEHLRSHEEPALWIADSVAWCYGAGGEWRRRIDPVIERVTEVGRLNRRRRRT